MSEETLQELASFISRDILDQPNRTLGASTRLISTGLVDSLRLVDLALFVEERFGVRIRETELNAETFDTLGELANLIETRKAAAEKRRQGAA